MAIEFKDEEAELAADLEAVDRMSEEELRAFLISEGVDPDACYEKLRTLLLLQGVNLPPAKPRAKV
jgi:hypothetical protein